MDRHARATQAVRTALAWRTSRQLRMPAKPFYSPYNVSDANYGCFIEHHGDLHAQWKNTFALMACYAGHGAFADESCLEAARAGIIYLRSLQQFNPFNPRHVGAIAEYTPETAWCFVRDSVSAAWGYLAIYRQTGDEEYLRRAQLFHDWLLREGLDREGYPYWGLIINEKGFAFEPPDANHHLQGSFHGGTLNLFYQLYRATGDEKYLQGPCRRLAEMVLERIQQPDGTFRTYDTRAGGPVAEDPQSDLHKTNDDLTTVGLLALHQATGEARYLQAVEKFLGYLRERFQPGVGLPGHRSGLPVAINILLEHGRHTGQTSRHAELVGQMVDHLLASQDQSDDPALRGAFYGPAGQDQVDSRTTNYAILALLKYLDLDWRFLGLSDMAGPSHG